MSLITDTLFIVEKKTKAQTADYFCSKWTPIPVLYLKPEDAYYWGGVVQFVGVFI